MLQVVLIKLIDFNYGNYRFKNYFSLKFLNFLRDFLPVLFTSQLTQSLR